METTAWHAGIQSRARPIIARQTTPRRAGCLLSTRGKAMSEEQIVRNCAPTLAAIKTGSLFSAGFSSRRRLREELEELNRSLNPRGLRALSLRWRDGRALIYIYRPRRLARDLRHPEARALLKKRGYPGLSLEQDLEHLTRRICDLEEFPHEIGLFLSYPPEDVAGFIENKARNCKCCGCWKVYGDEVKAKETFRRFHRCTEEYCRLWNRGYTLSQLAVSL